MTETLATDWTGGTAQTSAIYQAFARKSLAAALSVAALNVASLDHESGPDSVRTTVLAPTARPNR